MLALQFEEHAAKQPRHFIGGDGKKGGDGLGNGDVGESKFASSLGIQLWMLFGRSFAMVRREKLNNAARLLMQVRILVVHPKVLTTGPPNSCLTSLLQPSSNPPLTAASNPPLILQVIFGVFLGLIWLGEGDSPSGQQISSIAGALFFCVVHNAFNGVFAICNIFPLERNIVLKERMSNTYHVGPYFFAACTVPRRRDLGLGGPLGARIACICAVIRGQEPPAMTAD